MDVIQGDKEVLSELAAKENKLKKAFEAQNTSMFMFATVLAICYVLTIYYVLAIYYVLVQICTHICIHMQSYPCLSLTSLHPLSSSVFTECAGQQADINSLKKKIGQVKVVLEELPQVLSLIYLMTLITLAN